MATVPPTSTQPELPRAGARGSRLSGPRPLRTWWVPALIALVLLIVGVARNIPKLAPEFGRDGWELVQRLAGDLRRTEPALFGDFRPLNAGQLGRPEALPPTHPGGSFNEGIRRIVARAPVEAQAALRAHWAMRCGAWQAAVSAVAEPSPGTEPTTLNGLKAALVRWGYWPAGGAAPD